MGEVRRFAVAGLEEAARRPGRRRGLVAGALDETGQARQGTATAGAGRHYLGCAGKVANGITTVHLSYVREKTGHALAGAQQQIPREHPGDPARPGHGPAFGPGVPHERAAGHRHLRGWALSPRGTGC
jgi:hypothetical protein